MKGRPLRFLGLVLGGWIGMRVAMLWPAVANDLAPTIGQAAAEVRVARRIPSIAIARAPVSRAAIDPARRPARVLVAAGTAHVPAAEPAMVPTVAPAPDPVVAQIAAIPPPLPPTPFATPPSRLSGSAWGIARGGARDALVGGQLGGSQAGVRLVYALGTARRVALAARASSPAEGRGAEAALGVEWRPAATLRVIGEQRIALDGGRGGPTLLAVSGLPPTRVAGLTLEGYAQGGAIARDGVQGFADGAARLTRRVGAVDLGVGAWGGAQRGATRVDVGPTIGATLPARLRLTLDWRARVAGRARPGSGPALSIGTDF